MLTCLFFLSPASFHPFNDVVQLLVDAGIAYASRYWTPARQEKFEQLTERCVGRDTRAFAHFYSCSDTAKLARWSPVADAPARLALPSVAACVSALLVTTAIRRQVQLVCVYMCVAVMLFHRAVYHVSRLLLFCLCRWRWLKRIGMSLLLHKFIKLFRNKSTTNSSNKNKPSKINFAHNNINIEMITCKILFYIYCILVVCIFVLFKKLKLKKLKKLKIKIILKILKN